MPNYHYPSYWRHDGLEDLQSGPNAAKRVIVSGTGDGGLIDALRAAYDFSFGAFSFRVAELLQYSELAIRLGKIERALPEPNQEQYLELARDITVGVAEDFDYSELKSLLLSKLRKSARSVIVVDQRKIHPFGRGSAPIHRLLLAFGIYHATIEFINAEVEILEDDFSIKGEKFPKAVTALVVRHGAQPYHDENLIRAEEWKTLADAQSLARSYSFKPAWGVSKPFPVPHGWSCPILNPDRFLRSVQLLAKKAFIDMGSNGNLETTADKFVIYNHDTTYRPSKIFGREVIYRTDADLEIADAFG